MEFTRLKDVAKICERSRAHEVVKHGESSSMVALFPEFLQSEPKKTETSKFLDSYGPSNPPLFCTDDDQLGPRLMTIEEKDPFGRWANADHHEMHYIYEALLTLPNDYDLSARYINRKRPVSSSGGSVFWSKPLSRAHVLNAILARGARDMSRLHREMRLKDERVYIYFKSWGIRWRKVDKEQAVIDRDNRRFIGIVEDLSTVARTARMRLSGYDRVFHCRYDRNCATFRTHEAVNLDRLVSLATAKALTGLTLSCLQKSLPIWGIHLRSKRAVYSLDDIQRLIPERFWVNSLEAARKSTNQCQCVFWSDHASSCGLNRGSAPAAALICEDFHAL